MTGDESYGIYALDKVGPRSKGYQAQTGGSMPCAPRLGHHHSHPLSTAYPPSHHLQFRPHIDDPSSEKLRRCILLGLVILALLNSCYADDLPGFEFVDEDPRAAASLTMSKYGCN